MLKDVLPNIAHVAELELSKASDTEIWHYAREFNYTIVTQDADFDELGLMLGFPPRIVWIRHGNCTTENIAELLRRHTVKLISFMEQFEDRILVLR